MFDSEQLSPLTLHELQPDFFSEDNCTAVGANEPNCSGDFRAEDEEGCVCVCVCVCACACMSVCACACVGVKRRTDDRGTVGR